MDNELSQLLSGLSIERPIESQKTLVSDLLVKLFNANTTSQHLSLVKTCMNNPIFIRASLRWVNDVLKCSNATLIDENTTLSIQQLSLLVSFIPLATLTSLSMSDFKPRKGKRYACAKNSIDSLDIKNDHWTKLVGACMQEVAMCNSVEDWEQVATATRELANDQEFGEMLFEKMITWYMNVCPSTISVLEKGNNMKECVQIVLHMNA